uniref:Uncharacterized protein n=1 Tax=Cacopsylla melanoneura TaxID=428564 RepID=A0A8D8TUN6_9HEMI
MVYVYALYVSNHFFIINYKNPTVTIPVSVHHIQYDLLPYNMWYDAESRMLFIGKQKDCDSKEKHKLLVYSTDSAGLVVSRPPLECRPCINELVRLFALGVEENLGMKNLTINKISRLFNMSTILMCAECSVPKTSINELNFQTNNKPTTTEPLPLNGGAGLLGSTEKSKADNDVEMITKTF